jgi:hypothetical protein
LRIVQVKIERDDRRIAQALRSRQRLTESLECGRLVIAVLAQQIFGLLAHVVAVRSVGKRVHGKTSMH